MDAGQSGQRGAMIWNVQRVAILEAQFFYIYTGASSSIREPKAAFVCSEASSPHVVHLRFEISTQR